MQHFLTQEIDAPERAWVIWEIPERVLGEPLAEAEQRLRSVISNMRAVKQ